MSSHFQITTGNVFTVQLCVTLETIRTFNLRHVVLYDTHQLSPTAFGLVDSHPECHHWVLFW
jgi:hypothetical protein